MEFAIEATGLTKKFGGTQALAGVDLVVPTGTVLGVLGPNGAGKTTAVRILATLLRADAGTARIAGHDVVREAERVRQLIGLTGQYASVDDDLTEAAGRPAKTYSGGMRRRLDLAASLVAAPPVLFLDEPTTGLDPQSRNDLWELLRELVRDGATLVLTTQYLEEADRLADNIVLLDHGRVAATGSPAELEARIGGERTGVTVASPEALESAAVALAPFADGRPSLDRDSLQIVTAVQPGTRLMEVVRALDAAGVEAVDVARRDATLDDVFLTLTNGNGTALEVAA